MVKRNNEVPIYHKVDGKNRANRRIHNKPYFKEGCIQGIGHLEAC